MDMKALMKYKNMMAMMMFGAKSIKSVTRRM